MLIFRHTYDLRQLQINTPIHHKHYRTPTKLNYHNYYRTPRAPGKAGKRLEVQALYPERPSEPPGPRVMGCYS